MRFPAAAGARAVPLLPSCSGFNSAFTLKCAWLQLGLCFLLYVSITLEAQWKPSPLGAGHMSLHDFAVGMIQMKKNERKRGGGLEQRAIFVFTSLGAGHR